MGESSTPSVDWDVLIRTALDGAGKGWSAHQVHAALPRAGRPSRAAVFERLRVLARSNAVHPWPGGKTPVFATRRFDDYLRERIEAAIVEHPRTEAELRKGVPTAAHPLVHRILDELVRSGRVHRHPKLGRREEFATAPADPLRYLKPLLEEAVKKLVKKGFPEASVRTALARLSAPTAGSGVAATTTDPGELIRGAILELNPLAAGGAPVYVPFVRVAIGGRLDKDRFDRAMLALLSQERIQLQAHPVPSQLTAEQKQAMVPDGQGSYYTTVGLR